MKKIIYRSIILVILLLFIIIIYLSTVGIKTSKLNNQISNQIKNTNQNFDLKLKDVKIILDPLKLKLNLKTLGTILGYKNKKIELEKIQSAISIRSFFNNQFSLQELNISTKSIEIKKIISFVRAINNDPKLYVAEKFIKKGYLIADINLEFDENGNIKKNYKIDGNVKEVKINLFKKYNFSKINFTFDLRKDKLDVENLKFSVNNKKLLLSKLKIKKKDSNFLISGNLTNKDTTIDNKEIKEFITNNISNFEFDKVIFSSENIFSFKINKNLKFENLKIDSNINLKSISLIDEIKLKNIFPKFDNKIELLNHKIKLNYDNKILKIKGAGDFSLDKTDKVKYIITRKNKNLNFDTNLSISKNLFELDFINFKKKDNSNLEININGKKDFKGNLHLKNISLSEKSNKIDIKNLMFTNNFEFENLDKIDLNYLDKDELRNKISIFKKNKNYVINGEQFNADKIIENLLKPNKKNKNFLSGNFRLDIDINKTHLDKETVINNLNGYLLFKNNSILEANLKSKFFDDKNIKFTIKTKDNQKITTLFSENAKPLVNRYKFIKGFEEGSLDFYSLKNGNNTNSTLKIYDFKLKELPVLTKLLTLASLQGIADLLSGEGIRFNEFEMNFSNKDKLMNIDEIYAIGPAISILMSGYLESDKLVSLRGTLVPATTLNKTIGSIPILGDILVGKKVGEGVFGVSFKIKGPPKKLETTVNPIKTLTPRFITRTLEKIKKN